MFTLDLDRLAQRLPARPLTRFAPSPTGYLHLGHVANAIFVWGVARALEGRVLLRLEDHDRGRCRADYETALLDDLDWLGLEPDLGSTADFRSGPMSNRQSDSSDRYQAALNRLGHDGSLYACDCSRKDIAAEGGDEFHRETRYPGRCRDRGLPMGEGRGIRLRMEPGPEHFEDAVMGLLTQSPSEQCGDLLLRDRLGNWTYQFAVTVDDLDQGVDLVVRGADLLGSTGRQLRLARLLGRESSPVFLHHPLIRKPNGAKLSKASGDTGIRELRGAGETPAAVLGRAARLTGLLTQQRDLPAKDLAALFIRK